MQQQEHAQQLSQQFVALMEENIAPEDPKAQALLAEYYQVRVKPFYHFARDEFIQFCKMQTQEGKSKQYFDAVPPDFAVYVMKVAMFYAKHHLK